jgi:hypothetical protein
MQEHITVRTHLPHDPTQNRNEFGSNETHVLLGHNGQSVGTPAARAAGRGGAGAGLVPSQTSDPRSPQPERLLVDREATRLRRLKSRVLTAARLHQQSKPKWRVAMITPTYAPSSEWNRCDITGLVKCIRKWLARRGIEMRYVWVLEYTKAGRPHYHMLLWLPLGITLPMPDKRGWWSKGWTKTEWARNAVGYIAKYASKGSALVQYEPGARHHGNGGMNGAAQLEQRWWALPTWLRDEAHPIDRCKPRKGGGYVDASGQCYESPWCVVFEGGQVFIVRKREAAEPANADEWAHLRERFKEAAEQRTPSI